MPSRELGRMGPLEIGTMLAATMAAEGQLSHLDWAEIWAGCMRRIRRWRVPPHWSASDWSEEMQAQGAAVAVQAVREYDRDRGIPLGAFLRGRILHGALQRYRQEWAYARRCDQEANRDGGDALDGPNSGAPGESVRRALARLSDPDRWLIERLFWDGCTEAEVASALGISQPAVNKRKRSILDVLRRTLGGREEIVIRGYKVTSLLQYLQ